MPVLFSIRADGSLIRAPHVAHASTIKNADAHTKLSESAAETVRASTPEHVSARIGGSTAGRWLAQHLDNVRRLGM